jgi:hypothetical protein
MDNFLIDEATVSTSSSSSASWGAEIFNLSGAYSLKFTICTFEKGTDYCNSLSYEIDIENIPNLVQICKDKAFDLNSDWYQEFKEEVYEYLSYEPDYTYENQFDPPPSKPYQWHLIANKIVMISLLGGDGWKSRAVESAIKGLIKEGVNCIHIVFSSFLYDDKFIVSVLDDSAYEYMKSLDKFHFNSQDIFYMSRLTYSENFDN